MALILRTVDMIVSACYHSHNVTKEDDMKVVGMDVVVDEYVGRLTHEQAYELAYELLQKARQAWPYYLAPVAKMVDFARETD